jgi:hypothetical protein
MGRLLDNSSREEYKGGSSGRVCGVEVGMGFNDSSRGWIIGNISSI